MGTRKSSQAAGAGTPIRRRALATSRVAEPATVVALPGRAAAARAPRVLAATYAAPSAAAHARPRRDTVPQPPIALFPARAATAPGASAAHQPKRQRFGDLRDALADGWEIVQPIFARPLWSVLDDSKTAFNFVLTGPRGIRLVTVPEGRTVERFIHTRRLAVDYAR